MNRKSIITTIAAIAALLFFTPGKSNAQVDKFKEWLSAPQGELVQQRFAGKKLDKAKCDEAAIIIDSLWIRKSARELAPQWQRMTITHDSIKLACACRVFGLTPKDGRSLYISMHGGGHCPKEVNDEQCLDAIEADAAYTGVEKKKMKLGVGVLPRFIRDTTDRNRTSPFAFTGNKFEFRMLGSSNSIACANIMLNAAVAESLKLYADELEKADDFNTALHELIKNTIKAHKRIIFNGNGYDDAWITEATEKRGLLNLRTTPDAIPEILKKKNVDMLTSHKVFSEAELHSRYEIMLENYCKTVCIEAQTMSDMARKQILPAVERYAADVADAAASKKTLDAEISCCYEKKLVKKLAALIDSIDSRTDALDGVIAKLKTLSDVTEEANYIRDEMISRMTELRAAADEAEVMTAESYWPFPTYGDLLFGVK